MEDFYAPVQDGGDWDQDMKRDLDRNSMYQSMMDMINLNRQNAEKNKQKTSMGGSDSSGGGLMSAFSGGSGGGGSAWGGAV
jgi:uncharacterized membrane protein